MQNYNPLQGAEFANQPNRLPTLKLSVGLGFTAAFTQIYPRIIVAVIEDPAWQHVLNAPLLVDALAVSVGGIVGYLVRDFRNVPVPPK